MSENKVDLKLEKLPQNDNDANEINLKTTRVTTGDKLFYESKGSIEQQSFFKRHRRVCICLIILSLLVIFLVRIPFIGSYPDAFIFDYLWGCSKYIIYIWGICLCVVGMFKPAFIRTLGRPRLIIMQALLIFSVSVIFSAVAQWINSELSNIAVDFTSVMANYHSKHFLEYLKPAAQISYK